MKFDTIQWTVDGPVATVTISKPPVNALDSEDYTELFHCFYTLSKNEQVRVVVLTATGEKIFVGGSDVTEFRQLTAETGPLYTARNNSVRDYLYHFPKPVICAMNGSAFGGGIGLALMADIRLCTPQAKFNFGEINMGILGLTQIAIARCLNGTARKLIYTGERIDAEEALRIGLVDEILPADRVLPRAMELAKTIASKSPLAIKLAKQCVLKAEEVLLREQGFEEECIAQLWAGSDQKEAVSAFLEKREPHFQNQ